MKVVEVSLAEQFKMSLHFDRGYVPTQIQAGQVTDAAFRALNMWFRKDGRNENWQGVFNIVEDIPINWGAGTINFTQNNVLIEGTIVSTIPPPTVYSTNFENDVIRGVHIMIDNVVYLVREVLNEHQIIVDPAPTYTATNKQFQIAPTIQSVDNERAVLYGGSVVPYRTGTMAAVGHGQLYIGAVPQTVLKKRLWLGVHGSGGRVWFEGGLPDVTAAQVATFTVSASSATGGTGGPSDPLDKEMIEGNNSLVIARGRSSTKHFGNASEAQTVHNPGNGKVCVTGLPASAIIDGQDLWRVYASYQGLTGLVTDDLARNGPWIRIDDIKLNVATGGIAAGEPPLPRCYTWRNDTLPGDTPAYFDHDPPPDALYLTTMGDLLMLYSCHGPDKTNPLSSTAPGPAVRTSLPGDPESYPPRAVEYVNPLERINGALGAVGRAFAFTDNRVQLLTATAADEKPIVSRPLWDTGIKHQGQAVVVNDRLYAFSGGGGSPTNTVIGTGGRPTRSDPSGGEAAQDYTFSAPVQDVTANWVAARVFVGHDPKNRAVVFLHTNDHKAGNGKWVTVALAFMLETETWSGLFEIAGPEDMVITGATACAGQMYMIGYDGAPSIWKTYLWDCGNSPVICFVGSSYEDAGAPGILKTVRAVQVIGRLSAPDGGGPTSSVTLFRNNDPIVGQWGTIGPSGVHPLVGDLATVSVFPWWKTNLRQAKTFAVRVTANWPGGTAPPISFDEIVVMGVLRDVKHGSPDN
jgi:hypothetical protein